jgi:protein-tyrosine phosphatase
MLDSPGFRMAQVLVVCTGNICRSPMAEGFLKELLRLRAGAADETDDAEPTATNEPIHVSSAGTSGWDGSPATSEAVEAAADREADISGHRARRLAAHHVEQADLVIGMTTDHRDMAIHLVPTAAARTFTLKELVGLLDGLPEPTGSSVPDAARMRERAAMADALRIDGFAVNRHDLDVVDPIGLSIDTYRAVAWELDELSGRLVDGLFGKEPAPSSLAAMWKDGE